MSPRTEEQNRAIREETRQQIIDAAFALFASDGYAKTSIAAIAKKAGISKGLIYHYFNSKQEILEAIFDQLAQMGDEIMSFPEDFTPKDKIRKILDETFRFIATQSGLGKLMIGLALQPDAFATIKPKIDEINKVQTELFASIMGELGYPQPKLEAYELGALMDGILMAYVAMGDDYPLKEIKQKVMEKYVGS
ncbi:MAG: TetR/AcrR family transcriptional regulator [Balneolaceae bacterium]